MPGPFRPNSGPPGAAPAGGAGPGGFRRPGGSGGGAGGGGNFNRGPNQNRFSGPRINERIRVPKIRVIGPDGDQLGILTPFEALKVANEHGLDLVEISPTADPPVCKIMDYGKYKYEEQKKKAESKKKQVVIQLKEIKLRPATDKHDLDFKTKHIRRFLEDRDKVKITVQFRGREMQHQERGRDLLNSIIEQVKDVGEPEKNPTMEGRNMYVILQSKL